MIAPTALEPAAQCPGVKEFVDDSGVCTYLNVDEDRFILLREPDFNEIDRLVEEFKWRLHRAIIAYLSRSKGFARADSEIEYAYFFALFHSVKGRPNSFLKLNHEFLSLTVIREVLAADGIPVPKGDTSDYVASLRSLPLDRQRRLVKHFLGPDLDTLVSRLNWGGRTRLAELKTIRQARNEAPDATDFLRRIAGFALQYITSSNRVRGIRHQGRRGDGDSYDVGTVLLLLAWIRRHGILLFPAQHLDTRLFGLFSVSWSEGVRVADVVSLYLNDAEAEIFEYLSNELEHGSAFTLAKPAGKKKSGPKRVSLKSADGDGTERGLEVPNDARVEDNEETETIGTEERVRSAYDIKMTSMRSGLVNVFLKSNMQKIGPCLRDIMGAACEKLEEERGYNSTVARHFLSDAFRVIQNCYHNVVGVEPLVGTKRRLVRAKEEHLFPWAEDGDARRPTLLSGYIHDPRVTYWADVMDEAIRADAESSMRQGVRNFVTIVHHFLRFVWQTPDFPADILLVVPGQHMNDGRAPEKSKCFRAYLARAKLKAEVKNAVLNTLSLVFRAYIKRKGLPIDNPIDFSADKFEKPRRRGKTERPYIGRNHLEAIRKLNAAENFALSRSLLSHNRRVWDPDKRRHVHDWWPGIAIFFDFMLSVPTRSFVRFVDCGEGDEYLVDPIAVQDMIPNSAPWAERGRQEGIFYVEWPDDELDEEEESHEGAENNGGEDASTKNSLSSFIGLYINTNKTSIDGKGYRIPWCPDNVKSNLMTLIGWQKKFNPIRGPIPCLERGVYEALRKAGQDLTIEARVTTFPLFRDPANDDNWPLSKAVIDAYWGELLWAYQETLGKSKKRQRQFARIEEKDGRIIKVALVDIHTIRVTGVSALIEMGVPPDIVQQVVGHYTLVMTLYYSKQRDSRVHRILRQKIAESRFDPLKIEELEDAAQFEDLMQWLINNRSEEDAVGLTMYRERFGRGDGSCHVMEHGICPGGHCDSGGEFITSANAHAPVPPFACSLCRYRLTGPMFLVGLVHNANRLIFQYRRIGEEIARVNAELATFLDEHPEDDAPELEATLEMLYRQSEPLILQWFSERRYVEVARAMMAEYLAAAANDGGLPALITGLNPGEIKVAIEERPAFVLLQDLVEGAAILSGVRAHVGDAVRDHREFLNQVLAMNNLDPFLLKLPLGKAQEDAARVLGAAIVDLLSDRDLVAVTEGKLALGEAEPMIVDLAREMSDRVRVAKTIDISALVTLQRIVDKTNQSLVDQGPDAARETEIIAPDE